MLLILLNFYGINSLAINWGNKIRLYSIYVYDVDKNKRWLNKHRVLETNDTSLWDEHFAYRYCW